MPAQVVERDAGAVAAAPQVPARDAERGANGFEVLDERRGRVAARVDAGLRELRRAGLRARQRIDLQQDGPETGFRIGLAGERRRTAGAALVDEYDVARAADFVQARGERRQFARGLARPAGEDEQRVGMGRERVRREDGDVDRNRPAPGRRAILRDRHGAAARGGRQSRKPAVIERNRAFAARGPPRSPRAPAAATSRRNGSGEARAWVRMLANRARRASRHGDGRGDSAP